LLGSIHRQWVSTNGGNLVQSSEVRLTNTLAFIALTTCAWLLSLPANQEWQRKLHDELHSAGLPTSAADLEPLPILNAIVKEVLRLYPPAMGGLPRKTHKPVVLGPPGNEIEVPAGVTVHSQALTLHRSSAFRNPDDFDPRRWMHSPPEVLEEMERWYWPFASGSRACIGANLGTDNLKLGIATLFGGYRTEMVEGTKFALTEGFVSMPVDQGGYHLRLRVKKA
jgi:cytochrome P450